MRWMWAVLAILAVSLAGCGDDKSPEEQTYEAEGEVQPARPSADPASEPSQNDGAAAPLADEEAAAPGAGSAAQRAPAASGGQSAEPAEESPSSTDDSGTEASTLPELPALPPVELPTP